MKKLSLCWYAAVALTFAFSVTPRETHAAKPVNYLYLTESITDPLRLRVISRQVQTGLEREVVDWTTGFILIVNAPKGIQLYSYQPSGESSSHLYSLNFKKGTRVRLSGEMVPGGNVTAVHSIKSNKVVFYDADQEVDGKKEYYVTSTKKSKVSKLNVTSDPALNVVFTPTPLETGKGLIFRGREGSSGPYDLYLSMLKEAAPRQISPPRANPNATINIVNSTPRGKGIIYRSDANTPDIFEFFYHDVKKRVTFPLNITPAPRSIPSGFRMDPKDKYFYYLMDQDVAGKYELYRTNLKTREIQKISPDLPDDCSIGPDLSLDPKGGTMYYSSNDSDDRSRALYALDLKSLTSTRVTDEGLSITASLVDNKGNIYYQLDEPGVAGHQAYRKDARTGAVTPLLDPSIPAGDVIMFMVDVNGTCLLMRINADNEEESGFYFQNLLTGQAEHLDVTNAFLSDTYNMIRSYH